MRVRLVIVLLVLATAAVLVPFLLRPPRCPGCNAILVSIDTLRADHVGAYGYGRPTTPNIDAFAAEDAVLFENAIAQGSTTAYSHGSMLTGVIPQHHGASWNHTAPLHLYVPTLAEILTVEGWRSVSFNGGGLLAPDFGFDRGFAVYDTNGPATLSERVAAFERWLPAARGQRLFLFLHSFEVHAPYAPAPRFRERFEPSYEGPLPAEISLALLKSVNLGERRLGDADVRHIVAAYDAEIRSADEGFGRLRRLLRERGLYDDSLLILTGDHGEEFGEHGKYGWHSHTVYDEILRVPLLIKFPRSWRKGTRVSTQVSHADLLPTVLDVLGVNQRWRFDGASLVPLVRSEEAAAKDEFVVSQCDDGKKPLTSVRTMRWKLLLREGSEERTLFDLGHDPRERTDVAREHPDVVADYEAVFRRIRERRKQIVFRNPARVVEEAAARLRDLGYGK